MESTQATESSISQVKEIIDFLYIDEDRVNSLISQINNGTLKEVNQTIIATTTTKGQIKFGPNIINKTNQETEASTSSALRKFDPYHYQLIELLNNLSIPITDEIPSQILGKLILIKATIRIRDSKNIKNSLSIFDAKGDPFKIKTTQDKFVKIKQAINLWANLRNEAVTLTAVCSNGYMTGVLNPQYLKIRSSDLSLMYTETLPGEWLILGIADTVVQNPIYVKPDDSRASIDQALTELNKVLHTINEIGKNTIIPIMIFRNIEIDK